MDAELPRIGFAGVGRMGLPMCANLVRAGHRVLATDVRPERAADVIALGAGWVPSTAEAAALADVFITVLPGSAELRDAMLGGALDRLRPGTTWIDMTSCSPAVAAPLREAALARGVVVVEAPVGCGVGAAAEGRLQLFAGGRAADVERHRPLLEVLGTVDHIGDHGAGYTAKLLVNLLWFGQAVATAEALMLGSRAGIDLGVLRRTLGASAAGSEFIRNSLGALFAGDYMESFGLERCCEELMAVTELAQEHGVPFELSELVDGYYRRALERFGDVGGELLAVAYLEERAGLRLRA